MFELLVETHTLTHIQCILIKFYWVYYSRVEDFQAIVSPCVVSNSRSGNCAPQHIYVYYRRHIRIYMRNPANPLSSCNSSMLICSLISHIEVAKVLNLFYYPQFRLIHWYLWLMILLHSCYWFHLFINHWYWLCRCCYCCLLSHSLIDLTSANLSFSKNHSICYTTLHLYGK